MRTIRLVIAVLVGLALAAAPVAAGFAMAPAGLSKVGMKAAAAAHHHDIQHPDMPAAGAPCDASQGSPATFCLIKCCSVAAILVEAQPLTGTAAISRTDTVAAALSPFSRRPDPPPPRS
jgi:hypothetical protein